MTASENWAALAAAVKDRRAALELSRDQITALGGPSDYSVARIERGEPGPYRPKTLTQLERALGWESGKVAKLLGGVAGVEVEGRNENWDALAAKVRDRRERFGFRQSDLEAHGGPSDGTVRNIEQAARTKYASRTYAQLETALDWEPGTVARILDSGRSGGEGWSDDPPADGREALALSVKARRRELRLTQQQLAERGGPSAKTVFAIEGNESAALRPSTLARLDRALDWKSGTAAGILTSVSLDELGPLPISVSSGATYEHQVGAALLALLDVLGRNPRGPLT